MEFWKFFFLISCQVHSKWHSMQKVQGPAREDKKSWCHKQEDLEGMQKSVAVGSEE